MPKFIGAKIEGSIRIEDNARLPTNHLKLSYSQAKLLSPSKVVCSLNTSDKGGKGSFAKRWYNWYALIDDIVACEKATKLMKDRATKKIVKNIID